MQTVLLVVHIFIAAGLVGLILMQRSEGGALGIGGGPGGLMTGRSAGNLLTRGTTILGAAFFATSIALAVFANLGREAPSVLERQLEDAGRLTVPVAPPPEPAVPIDE